MKRIIILCLLLTILFHGQVQAQHPHNECKHEVGIEAGPFSFMGSLVYGTVGFFEALGGSISHRPVDLNLYGEYGFHYYYQVKPWFQVGFKATLEGAGVTRFSDSTRTVITDKYKMCFLTLMPSVRFNYLNRPWVRLYSSIDLGASYLFDSRGKSADKDGKNTNFMFAFNITPIGVTVGKRFYGLFETNFGYASYVVVGVGYKF